MSKESRPEDVNISPEQERHARVQRFLREECPDVKPKQSHKREISAPVDVFNPSPIGKMRTNIFYIDSKK